MNQILAEFEKRKAHPSDINEHMDFLASIATGKHVTEMGVRTGNSTMAFLAGGPKSLISYDIIKAPDVDQILELAFEYGIGMKFNLANVLDVEIAPCDILFIDTFHSYNQLTQELALHAPMVTERIVLHDTVTYGHTPEPYEYEFVDDSLRGTKGLWPAVEEMVATGMWVIEHHFEHNNGLTVLKRVN
jgi:predicted O-methyltransferase YrrM